MDSEMTELLREQERLRKLYKRDIRLAGWLIVISAICMGVNLGLLLYGYR